MKTIFVSWLGFNDFKCLEKADSKDISGGVATAIQNYATLFSTDLDELCLLSNWGSYDRVTETTVSKETQERKNQSYCKRLATVTQQPIYSQVIQLDNPTDYSTVYSTTSEILAHILKKHSPSPVQFIFHISSGTPTMQAIWLLLSKTEYPGTILVKTSVEAGFEKVDFPFDIAVKSRTFYTGDATIQNITPESLAQIKWQSKEMQDALCLAGNIARHDDMRVLIQGETGSGKELFAKLIHNNSKRKNMPFETINCGAIPENLIESELFGHKKGAFTGADQDKKGLFELANGGTIFLDEIGELPLLQQVKLLRMTDRHQQRFKPIGAEKEIAVDVRIIAATHRNLTEKVANGSFREDLFYRLCDAPLNLPSLRERKGDIECLAHHFVTETNNNNEDEKSLSQESLLFLRRQLWPGNVRELEATVLRAYKLYANGPVITRGDIARAMISPPVKAKKDDFDGENFDNNFNVKEMELKLRAHYILKAIRQTEKITAAEVGKLLGLKPGTFTKQLRENNSLRKFLSEHPDGERFLKTISKINI